MRILLTNDDGVYAPGIAAIYKDLCKIGDVIVVAPDSERSSIAQAITLYHPIYHKKVTVHGGIKAHALSGTPTDCVKFALSVLMKDKPDLVVSGINDGPNDGCSVFYSGTVGAAREGALSEIPSIAVSCDTDDKMDFRASAILGARLAKWVLKNGLPRGTFLNLNVPGLPLNRIKGPVWAPQCPSPILGQFRKRRSPNGRTYYWLTGFPPAGKKENQTDTFLLQRGYATIVPVHCDTTDRDLLAQVQAKL